RRVEITRDLGKLEAVRGGEREHDVVFGRGGLELEIELAAEALAQREPPGAVDAAAVGRVDDELHAADGIEEALEHDGVEGGQAAERGISGGEIINQLRGGRSREPDLGFEPSACCFARRIRVQARGDFLAQPRYRLRQLRAPPWRLAEPERDGRRLAMRVLDPHGAALDPDDAVGVVAGLENIPGEALDREILVDAADDLAFGL